jgi:hypothetical protein
MVDSKNIAKSLESLLGGAVDYAGLFPPAKLSMEASVANYAEYSRGGDSWMLGRFVVSASRLFELSEVSARVESERPWRVICIGEPDHRGTAATISEFNDKNVGRLICDMVETKILSKEDLAAALSAFPTDMEQFYEIAPDENLGEMLDAMRFSGQGAKIRTGGITENAFPEGDVIVRFVRSCFERGIAFKATAGLHHPIRCVKPLTYEPDGPTGPMHGFLNVFLMCAFMAAGADDRTLKEILLEEDANGFSFTDDGVSWRGTLHVDLAAIGITREKMIRSFGSCSFSEPVTELREFRLLN